MRPSVKKQKKKKKKKKKTAFTHELSRVKCMGRARMWGGTHPEYDIIRARIWGGSVGQSVSDT